ncbi:MAG TPA: 5-carboxymethyl-2-hydroxymuconate isomerase [Caldimonas sp.]|jgi:5-carboxymethyl-2-hydroxymuconate isomerase|nr:5-carboxymethyl-2-hydroxymuconate isomerase [Caldimonas sp.]HEX2539593.1 5-carboxymethyl-2-hydroxymuconate isomerase [Caldimonas sp.]
MPHVVIHYTANLGPGDAMGALCKALAEVIVAQRDAAGQRVFPIGGTRVLAYPASDFAVADGGADRAFVYLNVRIAAGRPSAAVKATGEALLAAVQQHFAAIFASRPIGITLQVDEGAPAFDAKHSNLHPLFEGR